MRICQIITRLIIGGAQENTLLTCEGLHKRGHHVLLLAGPECGPEGSLWPRACAGGYAVEQVPSLVRAVRPFTDAICSRELLRRIRRFAPDVVHTHSSKAGVLGRWAARSAGVPAVVHTIHGMSFNRTQGRLTRVVFRAAERICSQWTDRIVTVADAMTSQAVEARLGPPEKFRTIYSGVEVARFDPELALRSASRRQWGVPDDGVVVGTLARLQDNKGYGQLIRIMPRLAMGNPSLWFVWVGDGPLRDSLESQLDCLGLRKRAHLAGLVSPDEVPAQLAGMDILVHLSRWEGLPRAEVQASLMRLPVVGYDLDGAREVVVPGQTGELAKIDDLPAVEEHILALAADSGKRRSYGMAGRQRCLARFDHRLMVDRLDDLFHELARGTTPGGDVRSSRSESGTGGHAEPWR